MRNLVSAKSRTVMPYDFAERYATAKSLEAHGDTVLSADTLVTKPRCATHASFISLTPGVFEALKKKKRKERSTGGPCRSESQGN